MKIEMYQDRIGEWRWRFKAKNGRIIGVSSEGYSSKQSAINSIRSIWLLLRSGIKITKVDK